MFAPLIRKLNVVHGNPVVFAKLWSLWPPFVGAGIRVERISKDFREIDVSMKLSLRNANYVGTHFGGSLYAMTDPFYMTMIMQNLGKGYVVWDQAASIHFVKPGRGRVRAEFRLKESDLDGIRNSIAESDRQKTLWRREVCIFGANDELVATVDKTVYVRETSSRKK